MRLRTDRGWQEATIVFANFLGHKFVQQRVHSQDQILVPFGIEDQIVCLERTILQVKELNVVVAKNLLKRLRCIEIGRGIIARELVPPVENKTKKSPLVEFGLQVPSTTARLVPATVVVIADRQ